jgi:hypothetical protein
MDKKKVNGDDLPPMLGIKSKTTGITYFPKFVKNTQGEWELKDKEFQKILMRHSVLEEPLVFL